MHVDQASRAEECVMALEIVTELRDYPIDEAGLADPSVACDKESTSVGEDESSGEIIEILGPADEAGLALPGRADRSWLVYEAEVSRKGNSVACWEHASTPVRRELQYYTSRAVGPLGLQRLG
jgi:hypothetical protein